MQDNAFEPRIRLTYQKKLCELDSPRPCETCSIRACTNFLLRISTQLEPYGIEQHKKLNVTESFLFHDHFEPNRHTLHKGHRACAVPFHVSSPRTGVSPSDRR